MWHFLDLSQEQKLERRQLLDVYGSLAQISVLVPILLLQLYFLTTWIQGRFKRHREQSIPGSPYLKQAARTNRVRVVAGLELPFRAAWRRVVWAAGDGVEVWGLRVTKGEVGVGVVWTGWLLLLSFVQTKGDYLHLTKRFGIVGASQLPFQYLLAFKSPYSPIHYLTGCSWETLNVAHQLLGRITTVFFYLHTAFYLNFFIQAHVLAKRIKDRDVILGLMAVTAFTAVGTTALSWIRKYNYRVFYTTHVSLATILLPVLYFHVRHIRIYVVETLVVYAIHMLLRFLNEYKTSGSLTLIPGTTDLLEIKIPLGAASKSGKEQKKQLLQWQPGQHVYVSLDRKATSLLRPLKTRNPFTIASLPTEDNNLTLVARIHDGNTASMAKTIHETPHTGKPTSSIPLVIEGPYGLPSHPYSLLSYSRVLFVAGGVGATFTIPLYRSLLRDLSPGPGSRRRQHVKCVWAVRYPSETLWAVPDTAAEKRGMQERMNVYVTREGSMDMGAGQDGSFAEEDEEEALGLKTEGGRDEEGVELERLLPSAGVVSEESRGWHCRHGRPDLDRIIDKVFFQTAENESVAVVVCGPKQMTREVRTKVGKWIGKRDVWLHSEAFGL